MIYHEHLQWFNMKLQKSLFLSHPCQLDHGILDHPENPLRLQAILEAFKESLYENLLDLTVSRLATKEELLQVHALSYVDHILASQGRDMDLDYETKLTAGSVKAALSAAGLACELIEQVVEGKIKNGFALIRPPGHHARADQGMGFCIFNNIAIAAHKALSMGLKRILIFDWDVHHGNGTQECFYEDDRVLFIDIHQENLFPINSGLLDETGKSKGLGYTANIPLPPSCKDADYLYIFDMLVKPLTLKYQPELILVSAGFDAHESDPLGFMNLTTEGYGKLAMAVNGLAEQICGGKVIFILEGGYNPYFLARNVLECTKGLVHVDDPPISQITSSTSENIKHLVQKIHEIHLSKPS